MPPVAHSGPAIDRIGQLRVAAELLCCLGRPIHHRPPCAARPTCSPRHSALQNQNRKFDQGKASLGADTSQVSHFPLVFSPSQLPGRRGYLPSCPSRSGFHEAFHGNPQARLSFARPAESSRRGQAVWGTQPAPAPLISDPSSPPSDPSLPVQASSSPAHLQTSIRQNQNIFLQTKLILSPAFPRRPRRARVLW